MKYVSELKTYQQDYILDFIEKNDVACYCIQLEARIAVVNCDFEKERVYL